VKRERGGDRAFVEEEKWPSFDSGTKDMKVKCRLRSK
jgi:hypothetical protein